MVKVHRYLERSKIQPRAVRVPPCIPDKQVSLRDQPRESRPQQLPGRFVDTVIVKQGHQ